MKDRYTARQLSKRSGLKSSSATCTGCLFRPYDVAYCIIENLRFLFEFASGSAVLVLCLYDNAPASTESKSSYTMSLDQNFTLNIAPNKDDPTVVDLVDNSPNPITHYRKQRVPGSVYKIEVYGICHRLADISDLNVNAAS
jgi:hypothetical protein